MRILLDHAADNNYGLAAFNVNNMDQIQASRGVRKYTTDAYLRNLIHAAVELHPNIPIAMHQDHGDSPETCLSAIEQGFTSVMMDGSLIDDPAPLRVRSPARFWQVTSTT